MLPGQVSGQRHVSAGALGMLFPGVDAGEGSGQWPGPVWRRGRRAWRQGLEEDAHTRPLREARRCWGADPRALPGSSAGSVHTPAQLVAGKEGDLCREGQKVPMRGPGCLAKTAGPGSQPPCLPGAALLPLDCVCLCWLPGAPLSSCRLSGSSSASQPIASSLVYVHQTPLELILAPSPSPHGLGGALRSWLVGLAGLQHHRSREKQDVDGGPASRRRPQVSLVQRDPGREGPGTLPAGGLTSRKWSALPSGWGGGRWRPSHQGCGLSWTPGRQGGGPARRRWQPGGPSAAGIWELVAEGQTQGGQDAVWGPWSHGGLEAACVCACACAWVTMWWCPW